MSPSFRMLEQPGLKFKAAVERAQARINVARTQAGRQVADNIKKLGMSDIAGAGNFGSRWSTAWTAKRTPEGLAGSGENIVIETFFDGGKFGGKDGVNYAHIFEYGGTITAKNASGLLWIPLSFASDAFGISAKDFPGGLFRVDRKNGGAPLLLSISDKQPKYFGIAQVVEPKKFHLREIGTAQAGQFASFYKIAMRP